MKKISKITLGEKEITILEVLGKVFGVTGIDAMVRHDEDENEDEEEEE